MSTPRIFSRLYDPVIELPERLGLRRLRREVLRDVRGRVLELGLGTGRNIPLYPDVVDSLTGIDPDESMIEQAGERAREATFPVRLLPVPAEELPLEDVSFDAVTGTLVFCTIPDVARALGEARRVLAPGGELRLLEHVRMDREPFATLQETVTPVWKHLAGGCRLDRDTLSAVREAGFEVERVQRRLDGLLLGIFARKPR